MESYLKLIKPEFQDLIYVPKIPGVIELKKIADNLNILKIYIDKMELKSIPEDNDDFWFEYSSGAMLTNYAVEYESLEELDGQTIEIKNGWLENISYTMLSIHDGEPINNTKISFKKIAESSFEICWTGYYGEREKELDDVEIKTILYKSNNIVTPLCDYDEELIEYYK